MTDRTESTAGAVRVENTIPILRVKSLQASVSFYVDVLGFRIDWNEATAAEVSRDGHAMMLCEGSQGNPGTWVWVGVSDVAVLFEELTTKGATIRMAPTNFPWAYEMHVQDPDGHVLRLGSDPLDEPSGEWPS